LFIPRTQGDFFTSVSEDLPLQQQHFLQTVSLSLVGVPSSLNAKVSQLFTADRIMVSMPIDRMCTLSFLESKTIIALFPLWLKFSGNYVKRFN
jgi:hypothetical protein